MAAGGWIRLGFRFSAMDPHAFRRFSFPHSFLTKFTCRHIFDQSTSAVYENIFVSHTKVDTLSCRGLKRCRGKLQSLYSYTASSAVRRRHHHHPYDATLVTVGLADLSPTILIHWDSHRSVQQQLEVYSGCPSKPVDTRTAVTASRKL